MRDQCIRKRSTSGPTAQSDFVEANWILNWPPGFKNFPRHGHHNETHTTITCKEQGFSFQERSFNAHVSFTMVFTIIVLTGIVQIMVRDSWSWLVGRSSVDTKIGSQVRGWKIYCLKLPLTITPCSKEQWCRNKIMPIYLGPKSSSQINQSFELWTTHLPMERPTVLLA